MLVDKDEKNSVGDMISYRERRMSHNNFHQIDELQKKRKNKRLKYNRVIL